MNCYDSNTGLCQWVATMLHVATRRKLEAWHAYLHCIFTLLSLQLCNQFLSTHPFDETQFIIVVYIIHQRTYMQDIFIFRHSLTYIGGNIKRKTIYLSQNVELERYDIQQDKSNQYTRMFDRIKQRIIDTRMMNHDHLEHIKKNMLRVCLILRFCCNYLWFWLVNIVYKLILY